MSGYLKGVAELNISMEDLSEFHKGLDKFRTLCPKYLKADEAAAVASMLDECDIEKYYSLNNDRNGIFIKNMAERNGSEKETTEINGDGRDVLGNIQGFKKIDVVVAGGFHSVSVEALKKKGISCVVVTPNIIKEYSRALYEKAIQGKVESSDIMGSTLGIILSTILERGDINEIESLMTSVIAEAAEVCTSEREMQSVVGSWLERIKSKAGDSFEMPEVKISSAKEGFRLLIYSMGQTREYLIRIKVKNGQRAVSVHEIKKLLPRAGAKNTGITEVFFSVTGILQELISWIMLLA